MSHKQVFPWARDALRGRWENGGLWDEGVLR